MIDTISGTHSTVCLDEDVEDAREGVTLLASLAEINVMRMWRKKISKKEGGRNGSTCWHDDRAPLLSNHLPCNPTLSERIRPPIKINKLLKYNNVNKTNPGASEKEVIPPSWTIFMTTWVKTHASQWERSNPLIVIVFVLCNIQKTRSKSPIIVSYWVPNQSNFSLRSFPPFINIHLCSLVISNMIKSRKGTSYPSFSLPVAKQQSTWHLFSKASVQRRYETSLGWERLGGKSWEQLAIVKFHCQEIMTQKRRRKNDLPTTNWHSHFKELITVGFQHV